MSIRNDPAARFPKQAVRSSPCVIKPPKHSPGPRPNTAVSENFNTRGARSPVIQRVLIHFSCPPAIYDGPPTDVVYRLT